MAEEQGQDAGRKHLSTLLRDQSPVPSNFPALQSSIKVLLRHRRRGVPQNVARSRRPSLGQSVAVTFSAFKGGDSLTPVAHKFVSPSPHGSASVDDKPAILAQIRSAYNDCGLRWLYQCSNSARSGVGKWRSKLVGGVFPVTPMFLYHGLEPRESTSTRRALYTTMNSALPRSLRHAKQSIERFGSKAFYHAHTMVLFTSFDFKTVLFPITAFACAAAPLHNPSRLPIACAWIWLHQLMCNISGQIRGQAEDVVNKPWRPLPAERLTEAEAAALRWVTVALCMAFSAVLEEEMWAPSLVLFLVTVVYDRLHLAGHAVGKALCYVCGYAAFEIGATKLMGETYTLDCISACAICVSGVIVLTTMQTQDFADVEGDAITGRVTLPLYAPEFARTATLLGLSMWSAFLSWFWGAGPGCATLIMMIGTLVGVRFYAWRSAKEDRRSYLWFNVWLTIVHGLALNARTGAFAL